MTSLLPKLHHGLWYMPAMPAVSVCPQHKLEIRAALSSASAIGTTHMTPRRDITLAHWHTRMDPRNHRTRWEGVIGVLSPTASVT